MEPRGLHALNDLVIGGKFFNHRDIHKLTWASQNGHIIINGSSNSFIIFAARKLALFLVPRFPRRSCFFHLL